MKRALIALLLLAGCEEVEKPHLVTLCVEGHWGEVTELSVGRYGSHEIQVDRFICTREVTQCEAGDDFVGAVICGGSK